MALPAIKDPASNPANANFQERNRDVFIANLSQTILRQDQSQKMTLHSVVRFNPRNSDVAYDEEIKKAPL
jgi:hypothetical protein